MMRQASDTPTATQVPPVKYWSYVVLGSSKIKPRERFDWAILSCMLE